MSNLVIISMHEKGFPAADFYQGHGGTGHQEFERAAPSPDDFFTMKRGDTLLDAYERAETRWPGAVILIAEDPEEGEDDDDADGQAAPDSP